jgi:hypothetical protein
MWVLALMHGWEVDEKERERDRKKERESRWPLLHPHQVRPGVECTVKSVSSAI